MAALLRCLALFLISELFHQRAEAASSVDSNRALLVYNTETDNCKDVTHNTGNASKAAADEACERAFGALDRIGLNDCQGWRLPACRFIEVEDSYQCTCIIPNRDDFAIKNSVIRVFRDCAPRIWAHELAANVRAAPTTDFQQSWSNYDDALQTALLLQAYGYGNDGASTSTNLYYPDGSGSSFVANPGDGAGTSSGAYPPGGAGGSSIQNLPYLPGQFGSSSAQNLPYLAEEFGSPGGIFDSSYGSPSAEYTLYALESQGFLMDPIAADATTLYPCTSCPETFSTQESLDAHKKSHTTDKPKCPACGKTYTARGSLKAHMLKSHPGVPMPELVVKAPSKGPTIREPGTGRFVCGTCGKTYFHKTSLRAHEYSHKQLDTFCFACGQNFGTKDSYRNHLRNMHPKVADAKAAMTKKKYAEEFPEVCDQCHKRFKNTRGLREHAAVHEGTTKCDICKLVLPRKSSLAAHKKKEHKK